MSAAEPIRAEITGLDTCTALGVTVKDCGGPVLALCRELMEMHHDHRRPLHFMPACSFRVLGGYLAFRFGHLALA